MTNQRAVHGPRSRSCYAGCPLASSQPERNRAVAVTAFRRVIAVRRLLPLVMLIVTGTLAASARALAQSTAEPDTTRARLRLGPLSVTPTIEITNLGLDDNVFNDPQGQEKRDFTYTLTPKAEVALKMGSTWITGMAREEVLWYQKYSSERAGNAGFALGWIVPLNRLSFAVNGSYLNARDRPGFEIDARSRRQERSVNGLVEVRALSKTFFGVRGERVNIDFDKEAVFLGSSLRRDLNRTTTGGAVSIRHQLTPLTSIAVDVGRSQDRFEFSPSRDSDSTTAGVQVRFDPFALIKGTARFGYRDFTPADKSLPGYQGSTAAVDLTYSLLGVTRFNVTVSRDIQYSFDVDRPYYLQSGVTGSVAQQIYGPLDAVARVGVQRLNYRDRIGTAAVLTDRTDTVQTFGGGFGYRLGSDLRIGVNVDKYRRVTDVAGRRYNALRVGTSITYGIP